MRNLVTPDVGLTTSPGLVTHPAPQRAVRRGDHATLEECAVEDPHEHMSVEIKLNGRIRGQPTIRRNRALFAPRLDGYFAVSFDPNSNLTKSNGWPYGRHLGLS